MRAPKGSVTHWTEVTGEEKIGGEDDGTRRVVILASDGRRKIRVLLDARSARNMGRDLIREARWCVEGLRPPKPRKRGPRTTCTARVSKRTQDPGAASGDAPGASGGNLEATPDADQEG